MSKLQALTTLGVVCLLSLPALAQTGRPIDAQPAGESPQAQSTIIVTATAGSHKVRYVAIGEVNQTRLQVFTGDGAPVHDSGYRLGNLIDWQLVDQQGRRLADASYLFLLTVRDFSGNVTQKCGLAQLDQGQVYLQQAGRDELPPAQANALSANQLAPAISAVDRFGAAAVGAPTLPPDGPSKTADARQKASKQQAVGPAAANVTGAGTTNQLTKWTDGPNGVIGDSAVAEVNGNLGVGTTPNPAIRLDVSSPAGQIPFRFTQNAPANSTPSLALFNTSDGTIGQYAASANTGSIAFLMGATTGNSFGLFANNSFSNPQLFISKNGNVGIGSLNPGAKLEVRSVNQAVIVRSLTNGIDVSTASTSGLTYGVRVTGSSGIGYGVHSEGGGTGVYGGGHYGIHGVAHETAGRGVYGFNPAGGYGVYGESADFPPFGAGGAGVYGLSNSGRGVAGYSPNGYGVYGESGNGYAGYFNGRVRITSIPLQPSAAQVCFNAAGDLVQCGASSLRFKDNVRPFLPGLDVISRLRPISFDWRGGDGRDFGLGAEDVANVAPSLVFTNSQGEVTGVRYDRLNILLINAVKEQQAEIKKQRQEIKRLRAEVRRAPPLSRARSRRARN